MPKTSDYERLSSYTSAQELMDSLNEAINKYGIDNVYLEHDTEGWDDSKTSVARLVCSRDMTPEEIAKSEEEARAHKERIEVFDREQFERLKKKYGSS